MPKTKPRKNPKSPPAKTPAVAVTPEERAAVLAAKIKELIHLAKEQGNLTFDDINEALPESLSTPETLDEIFAKLRELEIEIVDQAEVDTAKEPEEEEIEPRHLDGLDDPVRMYLKQMGAVPLLTREQEVEISKRTEVAETELREVVYSFGFAAKEHLALAEKILANPPRERFDRVVLEKQATNREAHLKALHKLVTRVRELDVEVDQHFNQWRDAHQNAKRNREHDEFLKLDKKLQASFPKFCFKQKVNEEIALVAENIHDKLQYTLRALSDARNQRESSAQKHLVEAEQQKLRALEEFVRMPHEDFLAAFDRLLPEHGVRPTLFTPLWRLAGFALGAGTALLGETAAHACTEAVETVIEGHYAGQIDELSDTHPALAAKLSGFRDDELAHRQDAIDGGAHEAPAYPVLSGAIRGICHLAIAISEKL